MRLIIIIKWCFKIKLSSLINHRCSNTVAKHFNDIFYGHFHARKPVVSCGGIINPVFQMVLVAALMVKPGAAVAFYRALHLIGAAVPLIVFGAVDEFDRGIFGKVVRQPLPIKAYLEAVLSDKGPMMVNRFEMLEPFCH